MPDRQTLWGPRPTDWELRPWGSFAKRSGTPTVVNGQDGVQQVTVRVRHRGVVERRLDAFRRREILSPNQVQVRAGQFIISKIDARNGACGFVPTTLDGALVTTDFPVYDISPDAADSRYLDHLVSLPVFWHLCESVSDGTTNRVRLNLDQFDALPFPVPPVDEQRRIAEVLDSIDATIEKTEAVIASTERLRSALLGELLTRGVPGWHTEWTQAPGIGTIPVCWEVVRLGDVVTVRSGQADPRDQAYGDLLFVAPDDIEEGTGLLLRRRTVSEVGAISGKYEFDGEDVIYSKIRPYLRKVYLPQEAGLCSADMYPIRPGARVSRAFLGYTLLSPDFTEYSRTCSDRTGIPKINRPDLLRYQLALPPMSEQGKIANLLDAGSGANIASGQVLGALTDVKGRVAAALLSGRLRVGDSRR